jgi:hypothetical protein
VSRGIYLTPRIPNKKSTEKTLFGLIAEKIFMRYLLSHKTLFVAQASESFAAGDIVHVEVGPGFFMRVEKAKFSGHEPDFIFMDEVNDE